MNTLVVKEEDIVGDVDFSKPSTAIYVGTGGDLSFIDTTGQEQTRKNLSAGCEYNICAVKVNTTGTTASDLKALFV